MNVAPIPSPMTSPRSPNSPRGEGLTVVQKRKLFSKYLDPAIALENKINHEWGLSLRKINTDVESCFNSCDEDSSDSDE